MVKVRYPVWKYYSIVTEDNREKAKCVFCNKIFSNIPERMEKHLIYRCTGNPSPTAIQEVSQLYSDRVSNILHKTTAPTPKVPSSIPSRASIPPPPPSPPALQKKLPPIKDLELPRGIGGIQRNIAPLSSKEPERIESYDKAVRETSLIEQLKIDQLTPEEKRELNAYLGEFFKKIEDKRGQTSVQSRLQASSIGEIGPHIPSSNQQELKRTILQPINTELASSIGGSNEILGEKTLKDLIHVEYSLNQLQTAVQHINQAILKLKQDLQKILERQGASKQRRIDPSLSQEPPSTPTDIRPSPMQINLGLGSKKKPIQDSPLQPSEPDRSSHSKLDTPTPTKVQQHQHLHLHLNSSSRSPEDHNTYYT